MPQRLSILAILPIFLALIVLLLWSPAVAGEIDNLQIAQSKFQKQTRKSTKEKEQRVVRSSATSSNLGFAADVYAGERISKEIILKHFVGPTWEGTFGRSRDAIELKYERDGYLEIYVPNYNNTLYGNWKVDDKGTVCTVFRNAHGRTYNTCRYYEFSNKPPGISVFLVSGKGLNLSGSSKGGVSFFEQIVQSKFQVNLSSGKLNGTWMAEKQSPYSGNSPNCLFDWKIDKAVISGEKMSLFLSGKNKQQVVSGKINTEKMDFKTEQKLSVVFDGGTYEKYVKFAGNFKGDRFSGWYVTLPRYRKRCGVDFTLVSERILERKSIASGKKGNKKSTKEKEQRVVRSSVASREKGFDGEWVGTLISDKKMVCGFKSHPIKAIVKGTNLTIITRDLDSDVTLKGEISSKGEVQFSGEGHAWQYFSQLGIESYDNRQDPTELILRSETADIEGQFDENKFDGSIVSRSTFGCNSNFTMKRKIDPAQIVAKKKEQERLAAEQAQKIEEANAEEKRQAEIARQRLAKEEAKNRAAEEVRKKAELAANQAREWEKALFEALAPAANAYLTDAGNFISANPGTPGLLTIVTHIASAKSALKKRNGVAVKSALASLRTALAREKGYSIFMAAKKKERLRKLAQKKRLAEAKRKRQIVEEKRRDEEKRRKRAARVKNARGDLKIYVSFLKNQIAQMVMSSPEMARALVPLVKSLESGLSTNELSVLQDLKIRADAALKKYGRQKQFAEVQNMMAEVHAAEAERKRKAKKTRLAAVEAERERKAVLLKQEAAAKKKTELAASQARERAASQKRDQVLEATRDKYRDAVAVVIGNRKYTNRVPAVEFAHNDAGAMRKYLIGLGYRAGNIIFITDATQAQLMAVFGTEKSHRGKLFSYVRPGESDVTVFYSGHGVPGLKDRRGYLLPVDADPNLVELNGYPIDLLYTNLDKIPAKATRVYMDACFSGDSPNGMLVRAASGLSITPKMPKKRAGSTMISITAAQGDQFASWDEDAKHGLFTKHLLEALNGTADRRRYGNGDGKVTLGEVKKYLDREMTYQARRRYNRDQMATVSGDRKLVLSQYR